MDQENQPEVRVILEDSEPYFHLFQMYSYNRSDPSRLCYTISASWCVSHNPANSYFSLIISPFVFISNNIIFSHTNWHKFLHLLTYGVLFFRVSMFSLPFCPKLGLPLMRVFKLVYAF